MEASRSAQKLKDMIDKAIADQEITVAEYEKILHLAGEDGVIDREEKALLQTLQQMFESGEIKRVA